MLDTDLGHRLSAAINIYAARFSLASQEVGTLLYEKIEKCAGQNENVASEL